MSLPENVGLMRWVGTCYLSKIYTPRNYRIDFTVEIEKLFPSKVIVSKANSILILCADELLIVLSFNKFILVEICSCLKFYMGGYGVWY